MDTIFTWIWNERGWFLSGAGITLVTILYNIFKPINKENQIIKKQKISTKGNIGDGNYIINGNFNVETKEVPKKKRPIIIVDIEWYGSSKRSLGYSHLNSELEQPIPIPLALMDFNITWEYKLIIRNNSNENAYSLKFNFEKEWFNYFIDENRGNPILANEKREIIVSYSIFPTATGAESSIIQSQYIPNQLKEMTFSVSYKDDEQNEYLTEIFFDEEKQMFTCKVL
ncbi:MAG: hypothetical protein MUF43_13290 [Flavobacterium sp.]|jgi:hypothetical protein|nr:hypothetical protein [Flavobacterium sp.]